MTKLFIGGLAYSITTDDLKGMLANFGEVNSAQVITDRFTNQSKGFGFVEMQSDEEAQAAIKALDGSDKDGRRLAVSIAKPKEERSGSRDNNRNYFNGNNGNSGSRNRY